MFWTFLLSFNYLNSYGNYVYDLSNNFVNPFKNI